MKKTMIAFSLMALMGTANAEGIKPEEFYTLSSTLITVAPTLATIRATEITLRSVNDQHRGVAAREQLKDDLVALNDDVLNLGIDTIDEVRQPALKEVFLEIASNEEDMQEINSLVSEGTELQKIATVVAHVLLTE